MKSRRTFLALLLMFWLPIQGYAAIAMPFCKHATQGTGVGHTSAFTQHVFKHGDATNHAHHGVASAEHELPPGTHHHSGALDCNDCGACHLACSPALPPVEHELATAQRERFISVSPSLPPLFVPEQPKRPPLSTVA
jgi:hypothetical protein